MAIKNTNFSKVDLDRKIRTSVQNGSIPVGVTSTGSKYPINLGDISKDTLNVQDGPLQYPYYSIDSLSQNFTLQLIGDWSNKLKPADIFALVRGNIRQDYTVQRNITVDTGLNFISTITVNSTRKDALSFDPFVSELSYPFPNNDTYVLLNRSAENPNARPNLLKSFTAVMQPSKVSKFDVKVNWEIEPEVSATRLRWRAVPKVELISELSFNVITTGIYATIPTNKIISSTGRSAQIELKGGLFNTLVTAGGSGYTYATAVINGGGGSASVNVILTGDQVTTVNIVSTNYEFTTVPEIIISGDGSGAKAIISEFDITGLNMIQGGGGYMTAPEVIVDNTYLLSGETTVQSTLLLQNQGRVNYLRILDGGSGYTGASVSISGSYLANDATCIPVITDGVITDLILTYGGLGYTGASISITPYGTGGTGASAVANVDIYSEWVYEPPLYSEKEITLSGFNRNILYEIQILVSTDKGFRGDLKYSESIPFQYYYR